jgi:hypothetical protein
MGSIKALISNPAMIFTVPLPVKTQGKQATESDSSGLPARAVTVSWDASNCKARSAETGGGYLVYVSQKHLSQLRQQ